MKLIHSIILIGCLMAPVFTTASELSLGIGYGIAKSPYRGIDNQQSAIPIIHYRQDGFYISGLSAGFIPYQDKNNAFSVDILYMPLRLDPSDSDDLNIKLLNKRKRAIMAGASYQRTLPNKDKVEVQVATDISNHNKGTIVDVNYQATPPTLINNRLAIIPGIGVNWNNKKFNDYYFGVNRNESNRSNIPEYHAGSTFTPHANIDAVFKLTPNWNISGGIAVQRLTSDVKKSPIVERSTLIGGYIGVNYRF